MINATSHPPYLYLRDTALIVCHLANANYTNNIDSLREACQKILDDFNQAMSQLGLSEDQRHKAGYAQCALLDEAALSHLPPEQRQSWAAQPLQVSYFGDYLAGEKVYHHLQQELAHSSPSIWLLYTYHILLSLGFQGRYLFEGETARQQLIAMLDETIKRYERDMSPPSDHKQSFFRGWRPIRPTWLAWWAWSIAGSLYLIFYLFLSMKVAQLI